MNKDDEITAKQALSLTALALSRDNKIRDMYLERAYKKITHEAAHGKRIISDPYLFIEEDAENSNYDCATSAAIKLELAGFAIEYNIKDGWIVKW